MLRTLSINNYILIQNLDFNPIEGLNTITGETGAGKSIVLGALGLISGSRAEKDVLFDENGRCVIEAIFNIKNLDLIAFFENEGLDYEDETIIRREITNAGKSRAFVNDSPVNLNVLKDLSDQLIDIHSQFQIRKLSSMSFKFGFLDSFTKSLGIQKEYVLHFDKMNSLVSKKIKLEQELAIQKRDFDYNSFVVKEIEDLKILPNELTTLEEELNLLSNGEGIKSAMEESIDLLSETDQSILMMVNRIKKLFTQYGKFSSEILSLANRIESTELELKDIASESQDLLDTILTDPEKLELVQDRFSRINKILLKYSVKSEQDLILFLKSKKSEVSDLLNIENDLEDFKYQIAKEEELCRHLASELDLKRNQKGEELAMLMKSNLIQLGISEADIKIEISKIDSLGKFGFNEVNIMFSANKGLALGKVEDVASGGELSRFLLVLKKILAQNSNIGTLIFDEIDSGISGEVSLMVGQMMKEISENHQVIAITHLPQVAAMGKKQFYVHKDHGDVKTVTKIKELSTSQRVEILSQMIGGKNPDQSSINAAESMLARFN